MPPLDTLLANRRWIRRSDPFAHVVADEVFRPEVYEALCEQLGGILASGLSETPDPTLFSRNMPGYDAYGLGFAGDAPGPIGLFLSPAWRDLLCGLFGIGPTPYVFGGAHHHAVGGRNGFIHNDFNPVWFPNADGRAIQTPDYRACAYKTGEGPLREPEKVQVVRGAVAIFYLLNAPWRPGDGGETGLYRTAHDPPDRPVTACPPRNNSLVAFECTPQSFHAFLGNPGLARTSIIVWAHRSFPEATHKFGEDRLEHWK